VSALVRALTLGIGLAAIAAVAFGGMQGVQEPATDGCPLLYPYLGDGACVPDDGSRTTIGWGLTILLVAHAIIAGAIAGRGRAAAAVVWSLAMLAIGGIVALVTYSFADFGTGRGVPLWPRAAFRYTIVAIGLLHAAIVVGSAVGAVAARRRSRCLPDLPAATVVRR
jgi:hypothetical protein